MEITIQKIGAELVFTLTPSTHEDALFIRDFGQVGDKFKGSIKKDSAYKYPYIELRKDTL